MKIFQLAPALVLFGASATFAANLGALDLSSGSSGFANSPIAGSFTDTFSFSVLAPVVVNASVTTVVNGVQDVDFTAVSIAGPAGTFAFAPLLGDPVEVWATPGAGYVLSAGTYTLTLTGVNSAAAGSYGGNVAVSAVPSVPEPGTYAFLLAGLGAMAYVARTGRRA